MFLLFLGLFENLGFMEKMKRWRREDEKDGERGLSLGLVSLNFSVSDFVEMQKMEKRQRHKG